MTNNNVLQLFTSSLAELTSSGVPLKQSLKILCSIETVPNQVEKTSESIYKKLEEGISFSAAVSSCEQISVPEWYKNFLFTAEESGIVSDTLLWLSEELEQQSDNHSKIVSSLMYPAIVIILTFLCGLILSSLFHFQHELFKSLVYGNTFLVICAVAVFFVVKKVIDGNPVTKFVKALSYLTDASVPLAKAVKCAIPVSQKKEKLSQCAACICLDLAAGKKADAAFLSQFDTFGFKKEAKIISLYLSLAQEESKSSAFKQSFKLLKKHDEKITSEVVSCIQPLMLCIAALYMAIILNHAVVPLLYGGAGGIV